MALWNEDDLVEVRQSPSGYQGPGQLVSIAHGSTWLVRIEQHGSTRIITVKAQFLASSQKSSGLVKKKR